METDSMRFLRVYAQGQRITRVQSVLPITRLEPGEEQAAFV